MLQIRLQNSTPLRVGRAVWIRSHKWLPWVVTDMSLELHLYPCQGLEMVSHTAQVPCQLSMTTGSVTSNLLWFLIPSCAWANGGSCQPRPTCSKPSSCDCCSAFQMSSSIWTRRLPTQTTGLRTPRWDAGLCKQSRCRIRIVKNVGWSNGEWG